MLQKLEKEFLYSQDLSNCTTTAMNQTLTGMFLYSQDLSNCTTIQKRALKASLFLYSQDLSNCTTGTELIDLVYSFCTLKI